MMQYEVALVPDKEGMKELLSLIMGSYFIKHDVRPHIVIGVFETDDENRIADFFDSFAPLVTPIKLVFTGISSFGFKEIFVRVKPTEDLAKLFEKIYDTFRLHFMPADPHFVPGGWLPHTVIGRELVMDFFDGFMLVKQLFRETECSSAGLLLLRREPYEELSYYSF